MNSRTSSQTSMISYNHKIKWDQTSSAFNTCIWHLQFAISFSSGTVTRFTLLILLSQFSCVCVHVCVSVNWMVTFNCFTDHWIVGHKSFPIGRRQFFNCQINQLWPKKRLVKWLQANSPGDHINWRKKNVPLSDIPCKLCALIMNIDAHILNNCSFWTSDALCCHLNLREAV